MNNPETLQRLRRMIVKYVCTQAQPVDIPVLVDRFTSAGIPSVTVRQQIAELTGDRLLELTREWKLARGPFAGTLL